MVTKRILLVLALAAAALAGAGTAAQAATAAQIDTHGAYMNFWGGGYAVSIYYGAGANEQVTIQWLPGGKLQLRDNLHGGCLGNLNGDYGNARLGGGNECNSTVTGTGGGWGTVFTPYTCGGGYNAYRSQRWGAYVGYTSDVNGGAVYGNSIPRCWIEVWI